MRSKKRFHNLALGLISWAALLLVPAAGRAGAPDIPGASLPKGTILSASSSQVDSFVWKVGRTNLQMKRGSATPILDGDRVVGFFLKGEGSLEYSSTYVTEFPVMAFNLKQNKGPALRGSGSSRELSIPWDEAAVFTCGTPMPSFASPTQPSEAGAYLKHRTFFDLEDQDPLGHLLAWRALHRPESAVVRIELRKEDTAYIFELDQARSQTESLVSVKPDRYGSIKWMKSYTISQQPVEGKKSLYTPAPWGLTHLDLDLRATDNHMAKLLIQENIRASEPTRMLLFNMVTSLADEGRMRPVEVKSVMTGEGTALKFDHRGNQLAVLLPSVLESGQTIDLKFQIEGGLLVRHGGDNYWELGIFPWFPQPALDGQNYTVHATARVPKPFVIIMSGDTIQRTQDKNDNILETRMEKPICFFSLAAGKYTIKEFTKDGITVRLAGYAGLGASAERLAKTAQGIIGFYQTLLGKFPVKELNLVERTELGHGQAPPGLVWITSEAFDPIGNDLNRMYAAAWINQGLAHEIAHQYWGTQVKMASHEDQWLTESFAEYSSALAMVAMKGKGERKYKQIVNHWEERARVAASSSTIPMANRLAPGESATEEHRYRQDLVYYKGATLLHAIHCDIGDAAFRKWFWLLQSNLGGKCAETADILPLLSYVTKRDFSPFLEKYFWATELPTFPKDPIPPAK